MLAADRSFFDAAMRSRLAASSQLAAEKHALEARARRARRARAAQRRGARDVARHRRRDADDGRDEHLRADAATSSRTLWRRYLALMIDGLRPGATTRLGVRAATGAQVRGALAGAAEAGGGSAKLRAVASVTADGEREPRARE